MAVIGIGEENRGGNSFAASEGKVRRETIDADSTCNSFWEEEETGAGVTGAEGDLGAAQQGMVQQWLPLQQHDFTVVEGPDIARIGQAARRNPSSNATANLVTLKVMPFPCSFAINKLHEIIAHRDDEVNIYSPTSRPPGPRAKARCSASARFTSLLTIMETLDFCRKSATLTGCSDIHLPLSGPSQLSSLTFSFVVVFIIFSRSSLKIHGFFETL
jgi:hypothetical protein